jgi:uncharacterized protein YpmS
MMPRASFLQRPPQRHKENRRWLSLMLSALLVLLLITIVLWICRPKEKADNGNRTSEIISASSFQLSVLEDKPSIEIIP